MFTLVKLAFAACSEKDRQSYNKEVAHTARLRLRKCCYRVILFTRQPPSKNPRNTKTCYLAAKHGHLDCLREAHRLGCLWDNRTSLMAAIGGHTDCLEYAYENGCPTEEYAFHQAIFNKRSGCVRYLLSTGRYRWDPELMHNAADENRLDMVTFLHENGCPWSSMLMVVVATQGHLAVMQYAHEHGCPWDEGTSDMALVSGNYDCLKYAVSHGCPLCR